MLVGLIAGIAVILVNSTYQLWITMGAIILLAYLYLRFIFIPPEKSSLAGDSSWQICPYCKRKAISNEEKLWIGNMHVMKCSTCGKKIGASRVWTGVLSMFMIVPLLAFFYFGYFFNVKPLTRLLVAVFWVVGFYFMYLVFIPLEKRQ